MQKKTPEGSISTYFDEQNYLFIYLAADELIRGSYLQVVVENEIFKDSVDMVFDPTSDPFVVYSCKKCPPGKYKYRIKYLRNFTYSSIGLAFYTGTIDVLQLPEKR